MEIGPGIHQLQAIACQVFAILEDDVTLIDAGAPGSGRLVLRQLRQLGRSPEEVKRIILTHYHIDHRGAVDELRRATGARVLIHSSEAPYMRGELPFPNPVQNGRLVNVTRPLMAMMRGRPVEVDELRDGEVVDVMGGLQVLHSPGHTRGSVALSLASQGILFSGDVMGYRWRKLEEPDERVSEDLPAARASIERLAGLDVDTIAFSHFQPLRGHGREALERLAATWSPEFGQV